MTSAIFGHGKGTLFNKIAKDTTLYNHCTTLQSNSSSVEQVCDAGIRLFVALYGGKVDDKLSGLRYEAYCSMSLSRRFQPERLPPSEGAARMHAIRVHLQAVIWWSLDDTSISPTDWGWKLESNHLTPIQMDVAVTPENILSVVRCKCKGNCSSGSCSC